MEFEKFLELASDKLLDIFWEDENKHNDELLSEQWFYQNSSYYEKLLSEELN
jgi:hypothetical protein